MIVYCIWCLFQSRYLFVIVWNYSNYLHLLYIHSIDSAFLWIDSRWRCKGHWQTKWSNGKGNVKLDVQNLRSDAAIMEATTTKLFRDKCNCHPRAMWKIILIICIVLTYITFEKNHSGKIIPHTYYHLRLISHGGWLYRHQNDSSGMYKRIFSQAICSSKLTIRPQQRSLSWLLVSL